MPRTALAKSRRKRQRKGGRGLVWNTPTCSWILLLSMMLVAVLSLFQIATSETATHAARVSAEESIILPLPLENSKTLLQISLGREQESTSNIQPRIAYITFCHLNKTARFEEMIFGAVQTYLPPHQRLFVVLSDIWKTKYEELLLLQSQWRLLNRVIPIFVDCPEGKFGESPCCKQQKGLLEVLHYSGMEEEFDFYAFYDDDVYLRHGYLQSYLSGLFSVDALSKKHYVLLSGMPPKELGQMGYLPQANMTYYCSRNNDFKFPWGQPVIYPKHTLLHLSTALQLNGLVLQCLEFSVTHDVGNAILHWMFGLDYLWLKVSSWPDWFRPDFMGSHAMGRITKYQADATKTTFSAVHRRYQHKQYQYPTPHQYQWTNLSSSKGGFYKTKTYNEYGHPANWTTEWHVFPTSHCNCRGC